MASGVESVTLEGMATSGNVHLQTAEHVRTSYKTMESLAEQAKAGWTGDAGAAFGKALDAWMANYRVVANVLDQMHERMGTHTKVLTATHDATTQATMQSGAIVAEPVGLTGF
ncbi:WXG100 family type VII secretion target [Streptomyces griseoviridis]|uniref:WXG100 family type VII secretion target n=3 Tax=Streptomyces TaxID=1883 RepID=A0A918GUA8_STRGD|nr:MULTISPECIES: WXG100 family type VII secretion target [Streptomyces]GGS62868.1 hypothetical protein GCM10010238_59980 [Streptomyces niveoruber]GGT14805.1 hypothetical protein GCM10010240_55080 [Streptomyces griseoviridis]GGU59998.1 hypothetical protein GCM10010259_58510 [Streptomyces daghestanicus]GHI31989.1 hypothetical protein Sdagh_37190 [Streptomyces daghestanicus]